MAEHLTRVQHYQEAYRIYAEGEEALAQLHYFDDQRDKLQFGTRDELTAKMDEQGRKAHGCWAQATFHATMAAIPDLERLDRLATIEATARSRADD